MLISEILKSLEIPSNEIKSRFSNKQIKLNGLSTSNVDIDINENFIMEADEFLLTFYENNIDLKKLKLYMTISESNFSEMFSESSDNNFLDTLSAFSCLSVSKGVHYILMNN